MKIDTTRPTIARMTDYVLGGHHNFEVDRKAADAVLKLAPLYRKSAQLSRWFLNLMATRWAEAGVSRVLDLGSGLPTQGHLNEYLPNAQILFSDIDPLSVAHGQDLLKDSPQMRYVEADLEQPKQLFELAAQFFGRERKMAVCFIGISYFLSDKAVRALMQQAYDFCAPGSEIAISLLALPPGADYSKTPESILLVDKLARTHMVLRTLEELRRLVEPWRVIEARDLQEWLDVTGFFKPEERIATGDVVMNGMLAVR